MNQPVLSIDIAKGKSVAAAFTSYGVQVKKPFSFSHSPDHVSSLLSVLVQLEESTTLRPTVVMEATGNYSKPIASFFFSHGYPVFLLNPLTTHELKKRSTRKVKTDPIDAIRIANAFYLGEGTPLMPMDEKVTELRFLCRQHAQWKALLGEVQLQFRSILDLAFPGYDKAFQNIFNPSSIQLLTKFPSPSALLTADKEDVLTILMLNRRGRTWNEEKYAQLLEIARSSLPDPCGSLAHIFAMQNFIGLFKAYQGGITALEKQMESLAQAFSAYHLLRSIPGVGPITAAMIHAEIGDIKRFPSVKQLTAFAGLDSSVYESGTFKANQNRISKRGSAYLRTALYQATVGGISKQIHGPRNPILWQYYQQKRLEGKPSKVAIVATSNKLLRMIYGILSNDAPFQSK
ncbi:IS110 family transposase [Paenibacillus sp. N3/727]|uniref:IS110 family transposase n=1 Tax=Paenibacillus sp. N3/727 TaxID=2925845 RepID=UPI001F530081|nr:IS110 family transposase [Paenibacillus sp. N3/727]UNK17023.1 IS110 family transposase [Paenibacillus sp. N3/727]